MPATAVHVQVLIPNTYCYLYSKYTPGSKITPRKSRLLFYTPGAYTRAFTVFELEGVYPYRKNPSPERPVSPIRPPPPRLLVWEVIMIVSLYDSVKGDAVLHCRRVLERLEMYATVHTLLIRDRKNRGAFTGLYDSLLLTFGRCTRHMHCFHRVSTCSYSTECGK